MTLNIKCQGYFHQGIRSVFLVVVY